MGDNNNKTGMDKKAEYLGLHCVCVISRIRPVIPHLCEQKASLKTDSINYTFKGYKARKGHG